MEMNMKKVEDKYKIIQYANLQYLKKLYRRNNK